MRNIFATPSAQTLAARELEEASRRKLEAQSALEYASAMVMYHTARIERLKAFLEGV